MHVSKRSELGVAAVEFALVVPILVTLIVGTVEFGYRYQQNIEYTNAAMQAARLMSIDNDQSAAIAEVRNFTGNSADEVTFPNGVCSASNKTVQVEVVGNPASITHMFGATFTVEAKGQVRCE